MKNIKSYIVGLAAIGSLAFTACNMDVDPVPVNIPEATLTPNTTLLELKTEYWDDATNYIKTIETKENGDHYIIHGRVVSNDDAGNVFKSLVIQDETCALAFSINTYDLYVNYRVGQEIVIDATGMQIGKYNGLQQMGKAEWYENGQVWEASFMPLEVFRSHAQLNGLPDVAKVDTIQINAFSELPSDPDGLRRFQSQLVRFNNIKFQEGGKAQFSEYQSSGVSRLIEDIDGSTLTVRTSGYSDFWNYTLPEGNGDLVCILGYYGTTGWQLTLIDYAGCMNFGNPTVAPGSKDKPYSVEQAIQVETSGRAASGWVTGYIVGTVAPEVVDINSSNDIEWTAEATLANTLVIGPDPDCKDIAKCLVMSLPQDSKLREYAALRDNPEVYQRQIWVYGTLETYMGSWGLTGNKGTVDQFRIDGVVVGGTGAEAGDGSQETPYNVTQVQNGSASGTTWVTGYIVGWVDGMVLSEGAKFTVPATSQSNILIALTEGETDYNKCVPVQLPAGTVRTALNLQSHPENMGKEVKILGSIEKYFGTTGVKTVTEYVLGEGGGDTPVTPPATGEGTGSKEDPYNVTAAIAAYTAGTTGNVWVEGYIVGQSPTQYASDAVLGSFGETVSATNIIIATTASETDYNNCLFIQLPAGDVRNALNLNTNRGNMGKKVSLYGSLEKYFGMPGLKTVTEYVLGEGGGDTPVTPPATGGSGTGTETDPYNVTSALSVYNSGNVETAWVKGYIVGQSPTQYATDAVLGSFGETVSATNIIIAASASETNLDNCLFVQLPAGDVRNALNLNTNRGNLGKEVALQGSIEKYFGRPGIKTVTAYKLGEGGGGTTTPDEPVTPPAVDGGTQDNPYTVDQLFTIYNGGTVTTGWVEAYIVGWVEGQVYATGCHFDAEGDAVSETNILIAGTAGETDVNKCVPVQLPKGTVRDGLNLKANPANLGKKVKLDGSIEKYFSVAGLKTVKAYEF